MTAQHILHQSVQLMQRRSFNKARKLLQKLTEKQPNNADAWQLIAACDKNLGEVAKALNAFKKSLELQPAQPHTWNNLANLHFQLQEYDQAIRAYRKALQFDNNYDNAQLNLALALASYGEYPEAFQHFSELRVKYPNNPQVLLGIGDCLRKQERIYTALSAYNRALEVSQDNFLPLFKIGLTYKKALKWEKARGFIEDSLKANPSSTAALYHLASIEVKEGNLQNAIGLYKKCVQLEPENPDHHRWLNKLLWLCEDNDFLKSYEKIPEEIRYQPRILTEKCKFLRLTGRLEKAESELGHAISRGYSSSEVLSELSALYRSTGRVSESIQLLKKTDQNEQSHPTLRDELGRALLQAGEFEKCKETYNDLLQSFPSNQGFWCMYSTALRQLEDPEANDLLDYKNLVQAIKIPAPKGFSSIHEFNIELTEHLEVLHNTKKEPVDQSLSGGTQTLNDLFDSMSPLIQKLKQTFRAAILEHIAKLDPIEGHPFLGKLEKDIEFSGSWSVSLKRHGCHLSHFHTEGWLSSAYYVEVPRDVEKNGEGWIEFGRPEFNVPGKKHADYFIKPEEGLLVLFPSYMWHGTRPFTSSTRRLTVAFDATPKPDQ